MILDDAQLRAKFRQGDAVVTALRALADGVGATAVADYAWIPAGEGGDVREFRRTTPLGLVGLTERGESPAEWSLRVQFVSWNTTTSIAIVWHQTADDGFWEMHLGDGHPQRILAENVAAGMAFVKAALEAAIRA